MLHSLASDVRIWRTGTGIPIGVGFIVGPTYVATCAHVVADALGDRSLASIAIRPTASVELDFPHLASKSERVTRQAAIKVWKPLDATPVDDLAILELTAPLPDGLIQIFSADRVESDDRVRGYGIRYGLPDGAYVLAEVQGTLPGPRIQITSQRSDHALGPGCSGGALWSVNRPGVIGMATAAMQEFSGLLLPIEAIAEVCRRELDLHIPHRPQASSLYGGLGYRSIRVVIQLLVDEALTNEECVAFIREFPPGPAVDAFQLSSKIKYACTQRLGAVEAADVINQAGAMVLEALGLQPKNPHTYVIVPAHLPNPNIGMRDYWAAVFNQACILGPRMLVSLLVASGPRVLRDVRDEIESLLSRLKEEP